MQDETPQSLSSLFNALAAETQRDFSDMRGRFILVDVQEGAPYGLPNLPATRYGSIEQLERDLQQGAQRAEDANTSMAYHDPAHGLNVIYFNSAAQLAPMGGDSGSVENILAVIDHELGHLVVPAGDDINTPDGTLRAETQADLFGMLRRMKRGGNNPHAPEMLAFSRARALLMTGDADAQEHFTAFALMELAAMAKTTDLSKLTPLAATGMADLLGRQYALTAAEAKTLAESFAPYRDAVESGVPLEDTLKTLAAVTLDEKASANTRRLGGFVLSFYLDGKINLHGKPLTLSGDAWDDVRAHLKDTKPAAPAGLIIVPGPGFGLTPG